MYDKIRFGSTFFDFIRLDYKNNDRMIDIYILPKNVTIQTVKEIVDNAHGTFEHLDIDGTVITKFSGFINVLNVEEVVGAFNVEQDEKIFRISVEKPALDGAVEQNTVNIEYIAAMSDIDLEG